MTDSTRKRPPRILFFAPILEYPPAGGPQLSVVNAIKALHQICELHILTTVPANHVNSPEAVRFFQTHSRALLHVPTSRLTANSRVLGAILRRFRRWAAPIFARIDVTYVLKYAERQGVDVFWVDRVLEHAFAVFAEIRRRKPSAILVGDTCSVYSRFILRELPLVTDPIRRMWIAIKGRRKEREERELTASADVVTAVSELDAEYFRPIARNPERIKVFSNVVDLCDFEGADRPFEWLKRPYVLLLGSFGHQNSPMDRAAKWVAEDIMSLVLREVPDAHLYIVGRNADRTLARLISKAITVVGRVPSVVPYLRAAAATLVPLKFESGTRFKILESGAASIPCISTTLGAEGIGVSDKENILVADTAEAFAAAIVEIFKNPDYARTLGRRLHDLVAQRYSLDAQKREAQFIIRFLEERNLARN